MFANCLFLFMFDLLNFDIFIELIDVHDHVAALDVHQDKGWNHLPAHKENIIL